MRWFYDQGWALYLVSTFVDVYPWVESMIKARCRSKDWSWSGFGSCFWNCLFKVLPRLWLLFILLNVYVILCLISFRCCAVVSVLKPITTIWWSVSTRGIFILCSYDIWNRVRCWQMHNRVLPRFCWYMTSRSWPCNCNCCINTQVVIFLSL